MFFRQTTKLALPAAALLLCAAAQAAPTGRYAEDRAACASLPQESRAACVREAGAAAQAARSGQLTSESATHYEQNALARCAVFKTDEDKKDCKARLRGHASVSGSVEGGGLLREATTLVPAPRQ